MARFCGIASLVILTSSAVFHFATFIPAIPVSLRWAWPIHLAALAVFAAMVFSLVEQQKRQPKKPATGLFAGWRAAIEQNREFQSKLLGFVPISLRVACGIAFVYALVNLPLSLSFMEGGSPSAKNGHYYLQSHGRKIRDLTKEEYRRFRAYEVRAFTGHWMFFSIIPMTYFLKVHPRLQESTAPEMEPSG